MKLPEFLTKAIRNNTTSLGTHPALPPEEEETFVGFILKNQYQCVMKPFEGQDISPKELSKKLNELITECKNVEAGSKEALETLCNNVCCTIFNIPDDTIDIESKLVESCDMTKYRMLPEPTPDFTFNDIDELRYLTDEVYKRRMVDVLMVGAAAYYGYNLDFYIREIYKINPELIRLYSEIIKYNMALLYNQPDTIKLIEKCNSGRVDVFIGGQDDRIKIKAEGIIFPVLLEYTVRGLFEAATQNGLPSDMETADYILKKTDYRLAENWDMRLGIPLWSILMSDIEESGYELDTVGSNFILMEISKLKPETFNDYLQNAFKKTRKGVAMTKELMDTIEYNKQADEFDNFIKVKNSKYSINDSTDEYSPAELLKEIEQM